MLGHDGGAADIVDLALEQHAHGRRLGLAADHGAVGIAVDDGVADDMDAASCHGVERLPQLVERDAVALHDDLELFELDRRRREIDEVRGRIDDVAGREDDLAAIGLEDVGLLGGLNRHAACRVLEALGEIIRLDHAYVLDRLGVLVDDDVVDDLESGQIHRAQILRHVRPVRSLGDVMVGRDAGDQEVGLAPGVQQMADVAGMDHVEHAVAHDHALLARARADDVAQFFRRFDLVAIAVKQFQHERPQALCLPRY